MRSRPARQYRQELDTNIFKLNFSTLKDKLEIATGDPFYCEKCKAVFNHYSKYVEKDNEQIWKCEFCNHDNEIDISPEEEPKSKEVTYIVEAAAQIQDKKAMGNKEISVVFCMDQSGSMCVSEPV